MSIFVCTTKELRSGEVSELFLMPCTDQRNWPALTKDTGGAQVFDDMQNAERVANRLQSHLNHSGIRFSDATFPVQF